MKGFHGEKLVTNLCYLVLRKKVKDKIVKLCSNACQEIFEWVEDAFDPFKNFITFHFKETDHEQ